METLTHSIAELDHASTAYADVADRYHRLEHEFQTRDGYSIEAASRKSADGVGFPKRRLGSPDRRIFRRLADAPRARQAAATEAEPAAA